MRYTYGNDNLLRLDGRAIVEGEFKTIASSPQRSDLASVQIRNKTLLKV